MGNRNSGRRGKPQALKLLRGVTRKDRLNDAEPKPPVGDVVKPTGISASGGLVWDEMAPICLAMGTLTTADVKSFRTFCELQATLEQASASKGAKGVAVFSTQLEDPSDREGPLEVIIDAVLKLERETAGALRPFYEKFGLEPVGRARISVPKTKEPESKWAGKLA